MDNSTLKKLIGVISGLQNELTGISSALKGEVQKNSRRGRRKNGNPATTVKPKKARKRNNTLSLRGEVVRILSTAKRPMKARDVFEKVQKRGKVDFNKYSNPPRKAVYDALSSLYTTGAPRGKNVTKVGRGYFIK